MGALSDGNTVGWVHFRYRLNSALPWEVQDVSSMADLSCVPLTWDIGSWWEDAQPRLPPCHAGYFFWASLSHGSP